VRTSLDPVLQVAADKALRAGLIKYDKQFGGFRGPVARLDTSGLERDWQNLLAKVQRKPGMLPTWRLAVGTEHDGW